MELKLYDTLTRDKRVFAPIDPARVRMYVCGPTVYDFAHIGNARPVIVFDVLYRLLRHLYGAEHVVYVRNITDVDDKINARAARDYPGVALNEAIRKVTETTEAQFQADVKALGCLLPTHQPRATDFVLPRSDGRADMKSLIQELLDRGNAYVVEGIEGREVLFDVTSMPDYGALSGRKLEDQKAGARIAVDAHKQNPGDFVLWKESGAKEPGWNGEFKFIPNPNSGYEAKFKVSRENQSKLRLNSPDITIHGRPGWHIECSAMSAAYLGTVFDIHGGGLDLIFPHHENEIAQSRCAHGTHAMANFWMHNGFLQVEGEKMSKSLGNFLTIRELLEKWPGDVLRLQMLMTNYRQPIDWTERATQLACSELEEWAESLHSYFNFKNEIEPTAVAEALSDDLNTPAAIASLRELHRDAKKGGLNEKLVFAANCRFLGFENLDKPGFFRFGVSALNVGEVAIGQYEPIVKHLRAAFANSAPDAVVDSLLSQIRNDGLDIQRGPSGDITLVRGGQDDTHQKVQQLVDARNAARKAKDFKESDRIRDELAKMGVVLKDSKDGTTWEAAR
jgi:cysteinyl-tRNA synthetase